MKLRVGIVCPYSLSVPGGVQGQVLGLARSLRALGDEVTVLAPCDGPPPDAGVVAVGPSIQNAANGSVAPIAPDPQVQVRTIRALWDGEFDVVHVHEPLVPGPAVTAVIIKSAPLVGTFHAAGEQPAYRYLAVLARGLARRLDAKIAVSPEARALAEPALPGQWQVFFNGVEADRFAAASADPWPTDDDRPVVLFVGRHERRKGLAVLLAALERMAEDMVVWVAGEGPETAELRARFGSDRRIVWLGRISDDERDRRMAAATVFCAPSISGESFGVILLEAMAASTPVVAADLVGYRHVAGPLGDDPPAGVLVRVDDPAALADAIRRVIDDAALRASLEAAGLARAEHFSMSRLAGMYRDVYHDVIGVHRRGVPDSRTTAH